MTAVDELWSVAGNSPQVDATALAKAIEDAAGSNEPLDYRTRLLIRDSLRALRSHWDEPRYERWLQACAHRAQIEEACKPESFDDDPEEIGFPSLMRNVVDATKPETVLEFFRAPSDHVRKPTRLNVGGSLALILRGLLSRHTEDVDVVNQVPAELRERHEPLRNLAGRSGLQLAHFQSHYLPTSWDQRMRSFQIFGNLKVFLVDPYDVLVRKLCSKRDKDLDDLRAIKPHIDREMFKSRLTDSGGALLQEERLRQAATKNWYVLFGEDLPA